MACNVNKTQLLRTVAARGYAAQSNVKTAQKNVEVHNTVLPNKLCVTSIDNGSPISRIAVIFRAGSRFESYDNLGVTHMLRVTAGLTNKKSTAFGVTRNIQQIGGSIQCTTDRENVTYECEVLRKHLDTGLQYLHDVSLHQEFKPWEVSDSLARVKGDLARVSQQARTVDLLHRAAFRTGLGNSLYCAKHHVGKISPETLQHYVNQNFTASRAAVVGIGVDHQMLVGYAKNLRIENAADVNIPQSTYYGLDELKIDKAGDLAHVAIATQGVGFNNVKDACALEVLRSVLGCGPVVKYGNSSGILGRSVGKALADKAFSCSALSSYYADNGLFGFMLTASADDIGKGISAAMSTIKSASISNEDVTRAKNQLKANYLYLYETYEETAMDLALQASLLRQGGHISEFNTLIDGVTAADVNSIAKKIASGKWSMGAIGNLKNVPHVSQL